MNRLTPPVDALRFLLIGVIVLAVLSTPVAAVNHETASSRTASTSTHLDLSTSSMAAQDESASSTNITVHVSIRHPSRHVLLVTKHIDFPASVQAASVMTTASRWSSTSTSKITAETSNITNGHLSSSRNRAVWNGTGPLIIHTRVHLSALPIGVNAPAILTKQGVIVTSQLTNRGWNIRSRRSPRISRTVTAPENKSITSAAGSIYIGSYETYTSSTPNETITLVVTGGAAEKISPSPNAVLAGYRNESRLLTVGHRPSNLTVFVITDEAPAGPAGGVGGNGEIIIYAGNNLNQTIKNGWQTIYNTWFHEYVHNRQVIHKNTYGAKMQWYLEADANYYAALVTYNEHDGSFRSLWHTLHDMGPSRVAPLSNKSQWPSRYTEYQRGPKVLALFDTQIREQTNGSASFLDVMKTINQKAANGTTITLPVFEHALEKYLPKKTVKQDVSRYITGTQSVPISTRPAAYTLPVTSINTSKPAPQPPAQYSDPAQQSKTSSPGLANSGPVTASSIWNGILTTLSAYEHRAAVFAKYHHVQSLVALIIIIVGLVLRRLRR